MAIFYDDDSNCTATVTHLRGWITLTTTSLTTSTTWTVSSQQYVAAVNYELVPAEPKREMDYLAIRRIEVGRDIRAAQMPPGRPFVPWPRGKLTRWKSLKEKRASAGWH